MWRIPLFKLREALRHAAARQRSAAALREALRLAGGNMDMVAAITRLHEAAEWGGKTTMIFDARVIGGRL